VTTAAEVGYSSSQIYQLFQGAYEPSQSVVVFDAGTNDDPASPGVLQENLEAVASQIGDRCMVVPTIYRPPVNGVDSSGKNRVVAGFVASRPGTQSPDWAAWAADHQELMADDVHPTSSGYQARAQLIAEGVRACLAGAP
jgi:hypothetical protein